MRRPVQIRLRPAVVAAAAAVVIALVVLQLSGTAPADR